MEIDEKQAAQLADYIKPDGFDSIVVAIKRINHDGQQPCTYNNPIRYPKPNPN
jgi:hypothetical protein